MHGLQWGYFLIPATTRERKQLKSVALQALTNLGRVSSRRSQSFPTASDGTGLTFGQHIESRSCIFSFLNRTVTSLFK
jgi:hypothetical protein